jgi:hypothetical protein
MCQFVSDGWRLSAGFFVIIGWFLAGSRRRFHLCNHPKGTCHWLGAGVDGPKLSRPAIWAFRRHFAGLYAFSTMSVEMLFTICVNSGATIRNIDRFLILPTYEAVDKTRYSYGIFKNLNMSRPSSILLWAANKIFKEIRCFGGCPFCEFLLTPK